MTMMNVPAQGNIGYVKIQDKFGERFLKAVKKYMTTNCELFLASLAVANGNVPYQYFKMLEKNA